MSGSMDACGGSGYVQENPYASGSSGVGSTGDSTGSGSEPVAEETPKPASKGESYIGSTLTHMDKAQALAYERMMSNIRAFMDMRRAEELEGADKIKNAV